MQKANPTKKSRVLAVALAVSLAAAMAISGGTLSYLTDSTDKDVVNKFDVNYVNVDLTETGTDDNNTKGYEIIPGTSQEKDPKVTVKTSVDTHVFVTVEDTTGGLVTWRPNDGWTLLKEESDDETGIVKTIYWHKFDLDDATTYQKGTNEDEYEWYVLKDNQVSYSADLENSDMYDGGEIKKDLNLSFSAYAIQAEGFDTAVSAYYSSTGGTISTDDIKGNDATEAVKAVLEEAKEAGASSVVITLPEGEQEISIDGLNRLQQQDATTIYNLNGNTLKTSYGIGLNNGETLIVTDGTLSCGQIVAASNGAELTLKNTKAIVSDILVDKGINKATINIEDSTIQPTSYFGISTNASVHGSGKDVVINVKDSTVAVTAGDNDCTGILFNIPGTLNVTNSTISGGRQGMIVRCGTVNVTDSTITKTSTVKDTEIDAKKDYTTTNWADGNRVVAAPLTIGNFQDKGSTSYAQDAVVTLNNVTIAKQEQDNGPLVYLGSNDNYAAKLVCSDGSVSESNVGFSGTKCYFNDELLVAEPTE